MKKNIYRDFDRDQLDKEYNPRESVPEFATLLEKYTRLSADARQDLPCITDIQYGPEAAQTLDLFPAGTDAPLFIYIHGGYWRILDKSDSAFMAPAFTRAGIAVAAINYALVPAVTLDDIVRQCRQSIAWACHNAKEFGIDPKRIYVGGSSAGGHLVAMLAAGNWQSELGLPDDVIKGGLSVSGVFDLDPIQLSYINEWMQLDDSAVIRNSPVHHLPENGCPLIISYGGDESSEFKRQSDEFAALWKNNNFPCQYVDMPEFNHFDVILQLTDSQSALSKAVFELIGTN